MDDEARREVLGETILEELKAIREGVEALSGVPGRLVTIEEDISELKSDMKVIKAVIREHSADIIELKAQAHAH